MSYKTLEFVRMPNPETLTVRCVDCRNESMVYVKSPFPRCGCWDVDTGEEQRRQVARAVADCLVGLGYEIGTIYGRLGDGILWQNQPETPWYRLRKVLGLAEADPSIYSIADVLSAVSAKVESGEWK